MFDCSPAGVVWFARCGVSFVMLLYYVCVYRCGVCCFDVVLILICGVNDFVFVVVVGVASCLFCLGLVL